MAFRKKRGEPHRETDLPAWQHVRDEVVADVYEIRGVEPKYRV